MHLYHLQVQFQYLQNKTGFQRKLQNYLLILNTVYNFFVFLLCKTFSIGGPVGGTTAAAANTLNGGAIGDCTTDTFSVTSPGNRGSPIICGFNTGQHSKVWRACKEVLLISILLSSPCRCQRSLSRFKFQLTRNFSD